MDKTEFEQSFEQLSPTEKRVLELFVLGKSDQKIAEITQNKDSTIRKYVEKICDKFGIETPSNSKRSSKRPQLIALIAKFKPELLENFTPTSLKKEEIKLELDHEIEPTASSVFVGREEAMTDLNTRLQRGEKVVVILAPGGVGKTTLAKQFLETLKGRGYLTIEYQMAKEISTIAGVESVVEEWFKKEFEEEPGREFGVTLMRLKRLIQTRKVAILIDNLEPALNLQSQFIEAHRGYVDLLQVLADSSAQSLTLITTREPLCEGLAISTYSLPTLTVEAWEEFFKTRAIEIDEKILQEMHKAYGGNALAMKVLCDPIEKEGGMAAYWQTHKGEDNLLVDTRVENLIKEQFNRLKEVYPDAYKLLYRLGCYRYQEVPAVPEKGLFCLLWDVPVRQHRKVIEALKSRHLVEWKNQEYWLHPVIREEAVSRLRESEDWERANRKAAEFWTKSVETVETIDDAMTALEAYYHYVEIKDYEQAGDVITQMRPNKWEDEEPLGRACYRLGLLHQSIYLINSIVEKISYGYILSRLHNILGDLYWLTGNIQKAILSHEKSGIVAHQSLKNFIGNEKTKFWLKRLTVYDLFNTALCYLEIWKVQEAIELFEKVKLCWDSDQSNHVEKGFYVGESLIETLSCLAFLHSCLGSLEKASNLANTACNKLFISKLDSWSTGYVPLFLGLTYKNLGDTQKSFQMYSRALAFAKESNYTQVKAKALNGLAELYRIQEDFETAFKYHTESIELLDNIGAKCDLAEAYYQVGLTYQTVGETEKSEESFLKAIELFESMEAPRQVEKVQRAMRNS